MMGAKPTLKHIYRAIPFILVIVGLLSGCSKKLSKKRAGDPCPYELPSLPIFDQTSPLAKSPDYWLQQYSNNEDLLISNKSREKFNAQGSYKINKPKWVWRVPLSDLVNYKIEESVLREKMDKLLKDLGRLISSGKFVDLQGSAPFATLSEISNRIKSATYKTYLAQTTSQIPLRCYPTYKTLHEFRNDRAFDLVQCSALRKYTTIKVFLESEKWAYVRTSFAKGWVEKSKIAPIQPNFKPQTRVSTKENAPIFDRNPSKDRSAKIVELARIGQRIPLLTTSKEDDQSPWVQLAGPDNQAKRWMQRRHLVTQLPFNRENLFRLAFQLLDQPYGWGGSGGYRDCSRFLMDIFSVFGISLPRNSWTQGDIEGFSFSVEGMDDAKKTKAITDAAKHGIVLLYLPGHVMLYLGKDKHGLHSIHALSGYYSQCLSKRGETKYRVNRVLVTNLNLGEGSKKQSFLKRITRLTVIGEPKGNSTK